jgi:hypothetical protein
VNSQGAKYLPSNTRMQLSTAAVTAPAKHATRRPAEDGGRGRSLFASRYAANGTGEPP